MKQVYSAVFGLGAFFAMNCGSGDGFGYGSSSDTSNQQQPAAATANESTSSNAAAVKVLGHTFDPPELHVKAGTTVRWTWNSGGHNVVSGTGCSADGKFTSGDNLQGKGTTYEQKFDEPGAYPYFCDPHCSMGMKGTIVVDE